MSQDFPQYDDEIDLFELIETLLSHKILIGLISVVCGFFGEFWAFLSTPTYQAEIKLMPAEAADLARYNPVDFNLLSGLGISALTPENALNETLNVMRSVAKINEFVQQ